MFALMVVRVKIMSLANNLMWGGIHCGAVGLLGHRHAKQGRIYQRKTTTSLAPDHENV